ncbi:MAG: NAD-dependent epimerase/dehydratase family protein [Acidimicrobiia bacterium]
MNTSMWSQRRVLVTGATGMVGSWLTRRLIDEGAIVVALVLDAAVGEIKDQYLDATKAREVLGWDAAVTLEDRLARTVAWYQELLSGAE